MMGLAHRKSARFGAWLVSVAMGWGMATRARAEDELGSIAAVHTACREARSQPRPQLHVIEVESRLGAYRSERGLLFVDTRRNLRAFDGHVSLLISGLEPVAFEVDEAEAQRLRAATDARLRIGFFLGFDDRMRQPCVIRNAHAVTIVRADLAFAELLSAEGERLARTETERLRSWLDDRRANAIPGEGPRGRVGAATFDNAQQPPESWQRSLQAAAIRAGIAQCHTEGVARGAAGNAEVVVRLNVETRTGRIRRSDVAISSLGDTAEGECIARAIGSAASLPAGPSNWQADVTDLSVPVRLTTE